jgi:hypothetical protein
LSEVDPYLSQGGITLIVAEETEIKNWKQRPTMQIEPFEFVVQTSILGCRPDEL